MNGIFLPMLYQGLYGLNRRLYDGGRSYPSFQGFDGTFSLQLWAAGLLAVAQLVFIFNFVRTLWRGARSEENPWRATTLEWTTTSPPPHENWAELPHVHRGAYDYSQPGAAADFRRNRSRDSRTPSIAARTRASPTSRWESGCSSRRK